MSFREEVIGDARLLLGDCREILPTLQVDHVITDPPYEAVMQDKWGALAKRGLYTRYPLLGFEAIDEIRDSVVEEVKACCRGWGVFFCAPEGVDRWRTCIEAHGAKYKRAMVWVKPDALPQFDGRGPSQGFEMLVTAWFGSGHSSWNGGGRLGTFVYSKNTPNSQHPTTKPVPLMLELVSLFTSPGDIVADPFMGSGTTGVACAKLGRRFIGIELDEHYFNVACRRIEKAYAQPDLFIALPAPKAEQLTFLEAAE